MFIKKITLFSYKVGRDELTQLEIDYQRDLIKLRYHTKVKISDYIIGEIKSDKKGGLKSKTDE
jgi:hypothetical protein